MKRPLRPAAVRLVAAGLVLLAGCGDDSTGPGDGSDAAIPTDLTNPGAVLRSFGLALEARDLDAYLALLEGGTGRAAVGFRFVPRAEDLGELPWLQGTSWGIGPERNFVTNLFDPDFTGEESAVERIEFESDSLSVLQPEEGVHVLTADAFLMVLTGPTDGWVAPTRFVWTLVEDAGGFLRIRTFEEVGRPTPRADTRPGLESASWGLIKAAYHGPADFAVPSELLAAYFATFPARDLAAQLELLDPAFEFCIRDDDADEFPWLEGDCWDHAEEMGMIGNLFDPDYVGSQPPVTQINADHVILLQREIAPGAYEVTADALFQVLTGPNDGWQAVTRLIFELVPQEDGFLGISRCREVRRLVPLAVEEQSWGVLKALYR